MIESKPWNWEMVKGDYEDEWKKPCQEIYYLVNRWKEENKKDVLDLGCGIGRHAIFLAKNGFNTHAIDLSENAIYRAKEWAKESNLNIDFKVGDMTSIPYDNKTMDIVFSYYVISHTDTKGVIKILEEIKRVLKTNGEVYLTLGSKDSWGFKEKWPIIDANTKIRIEDGPDNNVPHFYADPKLIFELLDDFNILDLKQIQKIEMDNGNIKDHHHYHVLAKKR